MSQINGLSHSNQANMRSLTYMVTGGGHRRSRSSTLRIEWRIKLPREGRGQAGIITSIMWVEVTSLLASLLEWETITSMMWVLVTSLLASLLGWETITSMMWVVVDIRRDMDTDTGDYYGQSSEGPFSYKS